MLSINKDTFTFSFQSSFLFLFLTLFFWPGAPMNYWTVVRVDVFVSFLILEENIHSVTVKYDVQFSRSVVSDSLRPHESQHARPPCPSWTPRVYPNSCPSSQWCHPAISSSVVPFSFCPQFLPASGSFPISQLFAWGGKSIGVSASTLVLPMNTQDLSPLEWTGWISLQVQGTLKSLLQHHSSKASVFQHSAFFMVQLSPLYTTIGKTIALTVWAFVGKMTSLLFKTLSGFVLTFLSSSKHFLISWLWSLSTVALEPKKRISVTGFHFCPFICHEWWDRLPWS